MPTVILQAILAVEVELGEHVKMDLYALVVFVKTLPRFHRQKHAIKTEIRAALINRAPNTA